MDEVIPYLRSGRSSFPSLSGLRLRKGHEVLVNSLPNHELLIYVNSSFQHLLNYISMSVFSFLKKTACKNSIGDFAWD